jgi:hypothetical protein
MKNLKKKTIAGVLLCAACLPLGAQAQDEDAAQNYIYATYMYCDTTRQEEADAAFEKYHKPALEAAKRDGTITGWGYLVHHTGGQWRRIRYHSAGSIEALLTALDKVGEAMDEAAGDDDTFGQICNSHDDYIWRSVAGSGGERVAANRGKVGLSAYHVCKMSEEGRADEIVEKVFAPIYDAHVGPGKLRSWGWSEHIVGGKYRRLSTMTADDWPTLLKMRGAIFDAIEEQDSALGDQFGEICGAHSDYLWEIPHEG